MRNTRAVISNVDKTVSLCTTTEAHPTNRPWKKVIQSDYSHSNWAARTGRKVSSSNDLTNARTSYIRPKVLWDVTDSIWRRRLRVTHSNQQTALSTFREPTTWHQCDPVRRWTYLPSENHLTLIFQWAPQRSHSKGRTNLNWEILLPAMVGQSSCLPYIAIRREGIIIPDYAVVRHSNCLPDNVISREGIIITDYPVVWHDFWIWAIIVKC